MNYLSLHLQKSEDVQEKVEDLQVVMPTYNLFYDPAYHMVLECLRQSEKVLHGVLECLSQSYRLRKVLDGCGRFWTCAEVVGQL